MSKNPNIISRMTFSSAAGTSDDRLEAKRRAVDVGIADADAGRLIPLEEIKAWMLSWGTKNEMPRPKPRTKARS